MSVGSWVAGGARLVGGGELLRGSVWRVVGVFSMGLLGWLLCFRCGSRPFVVGVVGVVDGIVGAWPLVIRVPMWGGVVLLARLGLGRGLVAFQVFLGCLSWCGPVPCSFA